MVVTDDDLVDVIKALETMTTHTCTTTATATATATTVDGPIEFDRSAFGDRWRLRARLDGRGDEFSRDATPADLQAAGFTPTAEAAFKARDFREALRMVADELSKAESVSPTGPT